MPPQAYKPLHISRLCLRFAHTASRPFSSSPRRPIDDPVKNVANAVSKGKGIPASAGEIPSRDPSTPADSSNPALHHSADSLPASNNAAAKHMPDSALHAQQQHNAAAPERQPKSATQPLTSAGLSRLRKTSTPQATAAQARRAQTQGERLTAIINQNASQAATRKQEAQRAADSRTRAAHTRLVESQQRRIWREGDVYAPHDLSPAEQMKAQHARRPKPVKFMGSDMENTRRRGWRDVLDELAIDPVKEYKNFALMSEFVTEFGRIRHRRDTGLRGVNQRRMARAIRRAIALGLMPSVHRHPELHPDRLAMRGQTGGAVKFSG